jgi:hypothetical protein
MPGENLESAESPAPAVPPLLLAQPGWCMLAAAAMNFAFFFRDLEGWPRELGAWWMCLLGIYMARRYRNEARPRSALGMIVFAVVHNPVAPVNFAYAQWHALDLMSGVYLLVLALVDFERSGKGKAPGEP